MVLAAWAFGSAARGTDGPTSDLDIAILAERPLALMERLRLRADLVEHLGREVDLVVMNDAPPLLRWEVLSDHRRLFATDEELVDDFELRCQREYLDTRHLREVQRRLAREALA